jgi:hypothetical protein
VSPERTTEENLGTCLCPEQLLNAAAFFEREHVAPKLGDQAKLMEFEDAVEIRHIVLKWFNGSYAEFTRYASSHGNWRKIGISST